MTYVIGVTGGIGSGKTVVSDHFASLGVPVIDTDVIARQIVEPGQAALHELIKVFGQKIVLKTGYLDRDELRRLAFASKENKTMLDQITHPAIRKETVGQIQNANSLYCLVVVPLLSADSSFLESMNRVLIVNACKEARVQRVQKRSGLARDEVERIMQTQLSDEQREQFADDIIVNDKTIEETQNAVEQLHLKYIELAEEKSLSNANK